jgi:catechol 2,3-dioxygenase-like lactoylglutathione lyase family enzyme
VEGARAPVPHSGEMDAPEFETALPFFPVRDLAATRDFYTRDLGLRLARDQGTCLILAAGGAYLGFCQSAAAERSATVADTSEGIIVTLVTDAVDAWYTRLRRLGIETEGAPRHDARFGIYHFFARDPDGYRVEVQRFDEPLT